MELLVRALVTFLSTSNLLCHQSLLISPAISPSYLLLDKPLVGESVQHHHGECEAPCECSPLHRDSSCGDLHCRWVRSTTFTAEREAQDVEYDAAVRADEERGEEERQREEVERALAAPVQLDDVRAARVRRLAGPASSRGTRLAEGASNS